MSDTNADTPEARQPTHRRFVVARLADAVRRQDWFTVLVEVAIVVLGVVIGFQITAWGQSRTDAAKGEAYLLRLEQDLETTVSRMDAADSATAPTSRAQAQLLRAFRQPEAPPRDSVLHWLFQAFVYEYPAPLIATAQALSSSGDLSLITNDSLRRAIPAYLEKSDTDMVEARRAIAIFGDAFREGTRRVDMFQVLSESIPQTHIDSVATANDTFALPPGARTDPFPVLPEELLRDREFYAALSVMYVMTSNLEFYRANHRVDAERLLQLVQTAQVR